MTFLGFLKKREHIEKPMFKDDLGLPPEFKEEPHMDAEPPMAFTAGINHPMKPESAASSVSNSRDVDLILSKLDAIRSVLTNVEIRLAQLERTAGTQSEKKDYRW